MGCFCDTFSPSWRLPGRRYKGSSNSISKISQGREGGRRGDCYDDDVDAPVFSSSTIHTYHHECGGWTSLKETICKVLEAESRPYPTQRGNLPSKADRKNIGSFFSSSSIFLWPPLYFAHLRPLKQQGGCVKFDGKL